MLTKLLVISTATSLFSCSSVSPHLVGCLSSQDINPDALLRHAGTFICRFSMSQPGCLVLSCRVAAGHPNADGDGLLHAIIKTDDLFERRVETWVRDFPGATHILDVYKNKRVDKRKVFASNYTRLRAMDMLDAYDDIYI